MMKWWWGTMGVLKKRIENIKGAKLGNRGKFFWLQGPLMDVRTLKALEKLMISISED
jgi:hypothetical protein